MRNPILKIIPKENPIHMNFTMKIATAALCSLIPFFTSAQDEFVDSVQTEQIVVEPMILVADDVPVLTLDDRINDVMGPITAKITSVIFFQVDVFGFTIPFVLIWLSLGALLFTFYFGFINLTGFKHAVDVV